MGEVVSVFAGKFKFKNIKTITGDHINIQMKPFYIVIIVLLVVCAFWMISYAGVSSSAKILFPLNDSYLNTKVIKVKIKAPGKGKVFIDGRDIAFESSGKELEEEIPFADGPHEISITADVAFSPFKVNKKVNFTVDTKPPKLTLNLKGKQFITGNLCFGIEGKTEDNCVVSINESSIPHSGGSFKTNMLLESGKNILKVTAVDRAGNTTSSKISVMVDNIPPAVKVISPAEGSTLDDPFPEIKLKVTDNNFNPSKSGLVLDGYKLDYIYDPHTGMISYSCQYQKSEGFHKLDYSMQDKMGNINRGTVNFTIKSSDVFGDNYLSLGATGNDVRELQRRLKKNGIKVDITGLFDSKTEEAVNEFQKKKGIKGEKNQAGHLTIAAMSNHIIITLEDFSLKLYSPDNKLLRSYMITCGEKKYPTPTGSFFINKKEKDPTWVPPNSEWAVGKKITGPGKDNPLGTRWMGFIGNKVGIHGTHYPSTLGTASSHGCLRMSIPQSEELFELVNVGARVVVREKREKQKKKR